MVIVPSLGRGGAERQAVLLALALRDQGLDVRLFVTSGPDTLARDGLTGTLPLDLPPPSMGRPARTLRLRRAVEVFAPDAVITFLTYAEAYFAVVRATSAVARRAAWIDAMRGPLRLRLWPKNPAVIRATTAANLTWLRVTDRISVNCSALAVNLICLDDTLASKIVVVPNIMLPFAVDPAQARAEVDALVGGAARRPVIGCLGSFQEQRNYALLAEAMPAVLHQEPGAHVLIIGHNTGWASPMAKAFQARVDALGLTDRVILAGEIREARRLLAGLDVYALASKLEGSSNSLAEAMIAGAATATTPVTDAEDLVDGAAVVSRGFTPSAFAEALLGALRDGAALRQRAAARGRALLAERSPDLMGARWVALVDEAVGAARSRLGART
jgi:glycosyltransferase involved in cell wall biosynthesis